MKYVMALVMIATFGCEDPERQQWPEYPVAPIGTSLYDEALCEADYLGSGLYCCAEDYRHEPTVTDCTLITCGDTEPRRVLLSVSAYALAEDQETCAVYGPSHCADSPYGPPIAEFTSVTCEKSW